MEGYYEMALWMAILYVRYYSRYYLDGFVLGSDFITNIRYVTEWQIVVGLNKKCNKSLYCVSRPLDLSPGGASAEISSHSSTMSTIIFTHSTSQRSGQVSEVIGQCSGFICFILPFCFLARSPNKELISHYDAVALFREGWQQLAQPIRLKVWLDERVTIETVGYRVEHCVMNVHMGVSVVPPLFLLT